MKPKPIQPKHVPAAHDVNRPRARFSPCFNARAKLAFSLVELMIVVAIIGVLTAIAIPNFQKYQARAMQVEAKTALSGLYTSMQAFKAEWQIYIGGWNPLGFFPSGEYAYNFGFDHLHRNSFCGGGSGMGNKFNVSGMTLGCGPKPGRKFTSGMVKFGADLNQIRCMSASPCAHMPWAHTTQWGGVAGGITATTDFVGSPTGLKSSVVLKDGATGKGVVSTTVTANTFTAGAVGDPLGKGAATPANRDAWSLDHNKSLKSNAGANVDL